TVIGLLPLAVGGANVSGLMYFPMARTVMGGLMSSVLVTLVVLPFISLRVEALARWMGRVWRASAPRVGAQKGIAASPDVVEATP
ncbi:MAG TPA: hypothetical protein VMT16_17200, partial [Thermoanaerobaculia bacterium]|nr:hypothetical protein [Thermoanaerobaculia bacterium]